MRSELEKKFLETQKIDVNKLNANEPIVPKTHVPPDCETVVKLRIRTETGGRNIMLTMLPYDTIAMVYKYVKPYVEEKGKKFVLATNFPAKTYQEAAEGTLKELGLAPSCVMIVKSC